MDVPPLLGSTAFVQTFHLSVLGITYGLAFAFFSVVSPGMSTPAYFSETYFGSIAASAVLSVLALLSRQTMWLYVILAVRGEPPSSAQD